MLPDYLIEARQSKSDWRPPFLTMPYGIISIAGYVREYYEGELEQVVLNLNELVYEEGLKESPDLNVLDATLTENIQRKIKEENPDFILCSTLFNASFAYVETVVNAVNSSDTQALLIFGGKVATNHYELFLRSFPRIQGISYAEGEIPTLQLLSSNQPLEELNENISFITLKNLETDFSPKTQYVYDLDEIPLFAFDLLDIEKYLGKYYESLKFSAAKYLNEITVRERGLYVISTRGCPYDCVFCCSHSIHGKKVRYRSADNIINEIVYLSEKYKLDLISFQDDNFFQDRERAINILDQLIELNLDLKYEFANGIITYRVDDEIVSKLKKLGLPGMTLAIESGSEHVLKHIIRKPLNLSVVKNAVDILHKHDLRIYASFLFGLPGESEENRQESLRLIESAQFDWVHLFAAVPFSGSRLYDICLEKGYVEDQLQELLSAKKYSVGIINTPDFTADYISEFVYFNNLKYNFVRNPNFLSQEYTLSVNLFHEIVVTYTSHAVAHYMLYLCYQHIQGKEQDADESFTKFSKIVKDDLFWRDYAIRFGFCDQDGNAFPEPDSSVSF